MYINVRTRNSEYNPARFTGLIMRIHNPRATALIFRSGKLVCTGARSEQDSLLAAKKFARIIQKLGFSVSEILLFWLKMIKSLLTNNTFVFLQVRFSGFKIQNIVATCDLKFPIKLEYLNHLHGQFSSYEPELYPGLTYRMLKPRVVLLIFVNGKVVLTGKIERNNKQHLIDIIKKVYVNIFL